MNTEDFAKLYLDEKKRKKEEFDKILSDFSEISLNNVFYDKTKNFDDLEKEIQYLESKSTLVIPMLINFDRIMTFLSYNTGYTTKNQENFLIRINEDNEGQKLRSIISVMKNEIVPFLQRLEEIYPNLLQEILPRKLSAKNIQDKIFTAEIYIAGAFKE